MKADSGGSCDWGCSEGLWYLDSPKIYRRSSTPLVSPPLHKQTSRENCEELMKIIWQRVRACYLTGVFGEMWGKRRRSRWGDIETKASGEGKNSRGELDGESGGLWRWWFRESGGRMLLGVNATMGRYKVWRKQTVNLTIAASGFRGCSLGRPWRQNPAPLIIIFILFASPAGTVLTPV